MKKIITTLMVAACVLLSAPQAGAAFNYASYQVNYTANPTIGTDTLGGVTYSTVSYDGLYNGGEPGMPSLPIDYIRFSVPYNATNFTVTASPGRWMNYSLSHMLYPCQVPWISDGEGTPRPVTLPDTAAYYPGTTYPSQFAWVVDEGFLAGENHIVTVAVLPMSYSHTSTSDMVKKARYMSVTLYYTLSDTLTMYPIVRNDSVLRQEGFELARSMVVNPMQVQRNAPLVGMDLDSMIVIQPNPGEATPNSHGGGGSVTPVDTIYQDTTLVNPNSQYNDVINNQYQYLIITTPELTHSLRRLVALKRQKGYRVNIVTMDDINSHQASMFGMIDKNNNGHDTIWDTSESGKIRQFLRHAFHRCGTEYVLLVGSNVPGRVDSASTSVPGVYEPYLTDWYYCELSKNLFLNRYENSYQETCPDLFVGRILAKTAEQVNNYTDKLFRYEMNPGGGMDSSMYVTKALFTAGKDFKNEFAKEEAKLSSLFSVRDTLFERINDDYPKGHDVINMINTNVYCWILSQNHGTPTSIKTYGKDNLNHRYFVWAQDNINNGDTEEIGNGLNSIRNKHFPMIYYSLACSTMPYDYEGLSFGESFITGKDYGGPVYIGNTFTIHDAQARRMLNSLVIELPKNDYVLSKADIFSKSGSFYAGNRTDSKVHNYLGDPSLQMWTNTPRRFENILVSRTDTSITISGIDTTSVTVTLIDNKRKQIKTTVSSSGITFNCVSPNSSIMLNKHNYIPYILPMVLQNVNINYSQYLIASDVIAGSHVDDNRTTGDVVIKNGTKYEIEASGEVRLEKGFMVEENAELIISPAAF